MPLSAEARSGLAAQQAALVSALVAGGELPLAFDAGRLCAASKALAQKRARSAARAWSGLAQALGERFGELFIAYAEGAPLPREGGPLADGRAFARWLVARDELPEAGCLEALAVDIRYLASPNGLIPRKWPLLKVALLTRPRRLIVIMWALQLGGYQWSIPLGRS